MTPSCVLWQQQESLATNPRLSRWLSVCADGRVLVRSGKVELGQGVLTALAQIVAEELDVAPARVHMVPVTTGTSPDEAYTAGSLSVQSSGRALRDVCAQARALFLARGAEILGVDVSQLRVVDGTVCARDDRSVTYWEMAADAVLDRDAEIDTKVEPKRPADYQVVGRPMARLDIPDKVAGRRRFLHDLRPPGMLYGRVLRPPSRCAVLVSVDEAPVRAVPGVVAVHRDGSFLGVIAEREEVALRALEVLRRFSTWRESDVLPDEDDLVRYLMAAPAETTVLAEHVGNATGPEPATAVRARFSRAYLAHGSLAPSCGMATWDAGQLHVWTHSQGVYNLRAEMSRSLGLAEDDIVVEHVEGAGCYGHNGADDAAYDAALLARETPGCPVQVVWSRQDELTWSPLGPAMVVEVQVDVDADGAVRRWQQDVWSNGHVGRPGSLGQPPLLAATHVADARANVATNDPPAAVGGGSSRNAVPLYDLPELTVRAHRLQTMPLRTSALRALGSHLNVFAIESVVDELAALVGEDPIAYRLGLLRDERARAVLEAVASRSGWPGAPSGDAFGYGVGFAQYKNSGAYCAVVAHVEAKDRVLVRRLTVAVDVGLVVNPDGVVNQVEGGALQSVSFTTKEQVRFDRRRVTSETWEEYPILTFSEAPAVDVVLLDRPDLPSVGAGEASMGPTAAAIGNALSSALGVRIRDLPLSNRNIVRAIEGP